MAIVTQPSSASFNLAVGEVLKVVADAVSSGIVFRLGNAAGDAGQGATAISASTTTYFGPYSVPTRFQAVPSAGSLTVTQGFLSTFNDLSPANDDVLQRKSGAWANRTVAQLRTDEGLSSFKVAHCTYDFSVDGGVQSTIAPANSDTIPDNAILLAATINSPTAVTSGGSATVAIGTSAGSSTTSIKGATAKTSYSVDALQNGVPVFATPVKMTAAGQITFTIGTADLTAGVIEVWVLYVVAAS